MNFYRTVRSFNQGYRLTVMWLLTTAFIIAMFFMFLHPFGTILLFWAGMIVLGIAVLAGRPMVWLQWSLARGALADGHCPRCEGAVERGEGDGEVGWTCRRCSVGYSSKGAERIAEGEAE